MTNRLTDTDRGAIPMLLFCPLCRGRHVDRGVFATKEHHTHACQHCGFVWRPAVVPTVGVEFLPGFKDDALPTEGDADHRLTTGPPVRQHDFAVIAGRPRPGDDVPFLEFIELQIQVDRGSVLLRDFIRLRDLAGMPWVTGMNHRELPMREMLIRARERVARGVGWRV